MSVFDLLRSTNSIEHAPEPEPTPASAAVSPSVPGGAATGIGMAPPAGASPAKMDPPGVQASYFIESVGKERRYYKDLEGKQLAFRADGKAVTTKQEDRATVSHMLDVAQSRGWTSLHVRGSAAFKQEAWIEAQARGVAVKGYEPSAADRRDVQARRDARSQTAAAEAVTTPNVMTNTTPTPAPSPLPTPALAPSVAHRPGAPAPAAEAVASPSGKAVPNPAEAHDGRRRGVAAAAGGETMGKGAKSDVAAKLSPDGKKALAFLEQRIDTQMSKLTGDVKADLRTRAAQAIAKREAESGVVKLPVAKVERKQQVAKRKGGTEDGKQGQKPAQIQQPRVGAG